jgi:hypothetical protein
MTQGRPGRHSSSRYARIVLAAVTGLALALASATVASAGTAQPGQQVHAQAAADARQAPSGLPQGLTPEHQVIIHVPGAASGVYGYFFCLYNSQKNCISDTVSDAASGADGIRTSSVIQEVLTNISRGIDVYELIAVAHKSWKFLKKAIYNGKHVYKGKGDGSCMADFSYNQILSLRSCGDAHGIYWQFQGSNSFKLWNTEAKGDVIASSLKSGTRLFTHSAEDWSTWRLFELCNTSC